MTGKHVWSRRPVLTGLAATVAIIATGVGVDLWHPKRPQASGPYSDLINLTGDPQSAARVGQELHGHAAAFCAANAKDGAVELRQAIAKTSLPAVLTKEAADDDLLEVSGWVMPRSLVAVCFIAATGRDMCGTV